MKTFTTLIAEDEPLARDGLADWVRQLPQLRLLAACADGTSALQAVYDLQPELLLLDIQMPGLTGLQLLRKLAAAPPPQMPRVIFTTAYDEHAVAAFELHATDYLLKPFTQERFIAAVDHALASLHEAAMPSLSALEAAAQQDPAPLQRLLVRDGGRIVPLQVEAIEHLRSDTKYTAVTSKGRNYLVRLPITSFERQLDARRFLKLNRSCIVNLDFVESMTPDDSSQLVVQLRDGTRVTASREVSKQLRADSL
jgi:two-component system, LytTR family, response regulator